MASTEASIPYSCPICCAISNDQLCEPVQTGCGHKMCGPCLIQSIQMKGLDRCPICRQTMGVLVPVLGEGRLREPEDEFPPWMPPRIVLHTSVSAVLEALPPPPPPTPPPRTTREEAISLTGGELSIEERNLNQNLFNRGDGASRRSSRARRPNSRYATSSGHRDRSPIHTQPDPDGDEEQSVTGDERGAGDDPLSNQESPQINLEDDWTQESSQIDTGTQDYPESEDEVFTPTPTPTPSRQRKIRNVNYSALVGGRRFILVLLEEFLAWLRARSERQINYVGFILNLRIQYREVYPGHPTNQGAARVFQDHLNLFRGRIEDNRNILDRENHEETEFQCRQLMSQIEARIRMNIGTSVLAGPPQSRMSERQPGRQQQSGNRSQERRPHVGQDVRNRSLLSLSSQRGQDVMQHQNQPESQSSQLSSPQDVRTGFDNHNVQQMQNHNQLPPILPPDLSRIISGHEVADRRRRSNQVNWQTAQSSGLQSLNAATAQSSSNVAHFTNEYSQKNYERLKLEERKLDIDEYDKREARRLQSEQLKLDSRRLDLHEHALFMGHNNNGWQPQSGPKQLKVRKLSEGDAEPEPSYQVILHSIPRLIQDLSHYLELIEEVENVSNIGVKQKNSSEIIIIQDVCQINFQEAEVTLKSWRNKYYILLIVN